MNIDELRAKAFRITWDDPHPFFGGYKVSKANSDGGEVVPLAEAEAALAECERERGLSNDAFRRLQLATNCACHSLREDFAYVEGSVCQDCFGSLTEQVADLKRKLAECDRQSRLDKNDLDRFLKIITDLGLEFAPSEKVQWRNRKAIDLEAALAECEREKAQRIREATVAMCDAKQFRGKCADLERKLAEYEGKK